MGYVRGFEEIGRDDVATVGGKAANLGELTRAGVAVPPGFVLTTDAYRAFVAATGIGAAVLAAADLDRDAGGAADSSAYEKAAARIRERFAGAGVPADLVAAIAAAYDELGAPPVAVRSSATAEDLEGASFAGQQDTYLHVRGRDAVVAAVRDCWASLWTARAMAYRARQGLAPAAVALAVVVQEMVPADAAGVMFTADPSDGDRDHVLVAAAWGLGESVVGGTVDTDAVVVAKGEGRVVSRTTADKAVMTVPVEGEREGGTEEVPVPADRRRAPVLDDAAAVRLAAEGARIEAHYGAPQDIEWARAGDAFLVVQSRPITALPDPTGPVPTEWPLPDPRALYFRASIVEQLPDPLSPLFADLIDGAVSRSLTALMNEFLGARTVAPAELGLPTVNGYAYYRYGRAAMARVSLRTPLALRLVVSKGEVSPAARWRHRAHPAYAALVHRWTARTPGDLDGAALLAGVQELLDGAAAYYTTVQTVIPVAASSESLLGAFYRRAVRRPGDPPVQTFLLGFDSSPIRAEESLYDLAGWVRDDARLTAALLAASPDAGDDGLAPTADVDPGVREEWRRRFGAHLDRFGHAVYNLDFVNAVAADAPAPLLDTVRFHLRGDGADPYERRRRTSARREEATAAVLARLDPVRRAAFSRLLRWAQDAAPLREDALADVGLAWPVMRRLLRELGRRAVAAGAIADSDDVFWLHRDELAAAVAPGTTRTDRVDRTGDVAERRKVWRGQRRATPPQLLPKGTWMDRMERLFPAASGEQTGRVLKGIGASAGRVTAPARVLSGPADFATMAPGDVLVAGITTPAWTSLFTRAAAVVTDVGGPLSHSSIVAREYGIPAVLGTGVATRRITTGELITVDGDAGTVTLPAVDADAAGAGESATGTGSTAGGGANEAGLDARRDRTAVVAAAALAAAGLVVWLWRRSRSRTSS